MTNWAQNHFMKRPLGPVALLYCGGLIVGDWVSLPWRWLVVGVAILSLGSLLCRQGRFYFLGGLLVLTGWANMTWRTVLISPDDLRKVIGETQETVVLRGKLIETPYHRIRDFGETNSLRTVAFIDAEQVLLQGTNWQRVAGQVMVSTTGALSNNVFGGQMVEIAGMLRLPKTAEAPGLFDYREYLRRQGIYYQLYARSAEAWHIVSSPTRPPIADRFCAWAQATLAQGLPEEDEPLRLLWAMTLGWKTALTGEVSEPFMRSGTMHIFAISGLHIALIALLFIKFLQVFRVSRVYCGIIVIPLIWFYTGVTGWQASAIRSTIMTTVIVAGWSLKRPSDLLNSLAAAGLIILAWDPQQFFQASFQLSFFVVLSLALFAPVFVNIRDRWLDEDPFLPEDLAPLWRRILKKCLRILTGGLITSLAAWIGSAPLIAYYFHLFTPGSLLANLLVVPLSSVALACNLGSLVVGAWFPYAAELFNNSAWFCMYLMVEISEWFAWMRGACFYIGSPSALSFILYYAVVCSVLAGWLVRPKVRWWVGGGLAVLTILWLAQWRLENSATRLTILPLQGGEAIYLDTPGSKNDCLIDCGNTEHVQYVTQPFLRAQGVNRLPRLILTHGDSQHVAGAEMIRAGFAVREIDTSPMPFRSAVYRKLRQSFEEHQGLNRTITEGEHIGLWKVLHPGLADNFSRADDKALVLRGEFEGVSVLLLSDLGKSGQNAMASRSMNLRSDIVVAGLPSQDEPLAEGLLDLIQPRLIIITDSDYPATARASEKLQERLAQRNVAIIYTHDTGTLTLIFSKRRWTLHFTDSKTS
jgi:competence protein ComEC